MSDLKDFITAEKLPLTIEFTQQNTDKIFSSGINKQVGRGVLFGPLRTASWCVDCGWSLWFWSVVEWSGVERSGL
jgi:hypothetical protein